MNIKPNHRVAIFSPNYSAYSQTFIKAHKERLNFDIKYYYGGFVPSQLENDSFSKKNGQEISPEAWLEESLVKNKISLVLAEFGQTGASTYHICQKLGIPLVVHFHGYDAHQKDIIEEYGKRYKDMFEYSSAVIAVSRFMQRELYKLGCPKEKLIYSTYGPNDAFLNAPKTFLKKQFVSIGRFVDKKAPYFTILAFKKVLEFHPDATILFGGQGTLRNTCENLVKLFNLQESVKFLGVVDHKKVVKLFSESLAYVQHSIQAKNGDCEGTPVAIIEASGASLPVISTFHAGIPDVIKNGYSGVLVEEGDVDGMAEGMITLASDFNLAKKMGAEGRHIINEKFTMDRHISFLEDLLTNIIQKQSKLELV